jgi:pyruvate-formate lyase-activating enzyme
MVDRAQLIQRVRYLVRERPDDAEALLVDLIEYVYSRSAVSVSCSAVSVSYGEAVVQTPVSTATSKTDTMWDGLAKRIFLTGA